MKRGLILAVGGAAIVAASLSGCSSEKKSEVSSDKTTAAAAQGKTTVKIDGADQKVEGTVVCTKMGEDTVIAIGNATTGIGATLSGDKEITVKQVGLGSVNGMNLGYQSGVGQGNASASKDGKNYKITGTAVGIDMANPMQPANKPFEIEVACP